MKLGFERFHRLLSPPPFSVSFPLFLSRSTSSRFHIALWSAPCRGSERSHRVKAKIGGSSTRRGCLRRAPPLSIVLSILAEKVLRRPFPYVLFTFTLPSLIRGVHWRFLFNFQNFIHALLLYSRSMYGRDSPICRCYTARDGTFLMS